MLKKPENHRKKWTEKDVDSLKQLAKIHKDSDTPTRIIALKLWRQEKAIYTKAHELWISLKPTNQSPYWRKK